MRRSDLCDLPVDAILLEALSLAAGPITTRQAVDASAGLISDDEARIFLERLESAGLARDVGLGYSLTALGKERASRRRAAVLAFYGVQARKGERK